MRRIVCILIAVTACLSLAVTALAADVMTPSVPSKDAPTIVPGVVDMGDPVIGEIVDGKDNNVDFIVEDCLIVTPVSQANTSDKIPEEARQTLLSVYEQLSNGTMKLPYEEGVDPNKMVIKDLFDVSWGCVDHEEMVEEEANYIKLTLDADVKANTAVVVMVYDDGQWYEAQSVVNNGDGTISVVMDNVGIVAISVPTDSISETGDKADLTLWTVLLAVSAVALVALVVFRRRGNVER